MLMSFQPVTETLADMTKETFLQCSCKDKAFDFFKPHGPIWNFITRVFRPGNHPFSAYEFSNLLTCVMRSGHLYAPNIINSILGSCHKQSCTLEILYWENVSLHRNWWHQLLWVKITSVNKKSANSITKFRATDKKCMFPQKMSQATLL